jgi:hypothetical protein
MLVEHAEDYDTFQALDLFAVHHMLDWPSGHAGVEPRRSSRTEFDHPALVGCEEQNIDCCPGRQCDSLQRNLSCVRTE